MNIPADGINVAPWIAAWPGKSARTKHGIPHPAAYHMLDVAAVAECLLKNSHFSPALRDALTLLVALHDLGKIGEPFRRMLVDGTAQVAGRHWEATEVLLQEHDVLLSRLGSTPRRRRHLYAATAGHHGRPPDKEGAQARRLLQAVGPEARQDAASLIEAFCALWPNASLAELEKADFIRLSWWLPGLVSTADWVGSNAEWFEPQSPHVNLSTYLKRARKLAHQAVRRAGLNRAPVANNPLFDFKLRPMQAACVEIELAEGPMLAFIEDETGAGKTEAALLLAQRMMLAGKGQGLFVALPTTATADAMFVRVRDMIARLFAAPPNLALAHGRAAYSSTFRELRRHRAAQEDAPGCTDWLADNRRRALLAQVGVGTIDQALLSVLPTRYATLRHYGLASNILIVDEVHEMGEPYMHEQLRQLLRAHRMAGGSAILLSATLPLSQRAALTQAFGIDTPPSSVAYPALTVAGGASRTAFASPGHGRGPVTVQRLEHVDSTLDLITKSAERGASCVWIRNAVDDAIEAMRALRARGVNADVLHARFTLVDRLRHEQAALARFGKDGRDRAGRVLVGTQVLESSLDLDFDVMVSDLAPMAALIQRAGRLWRHMAPRPAAKRPVPKPILYVLAPDPLLVEDDRWLHNILDKGAWVYPLDIQWRTAQVLFEAGVIDAPARLRALIEPVHGADHGANGPSLPSALEQAEIERLGKSYSEANQGRHNVTKLELGYRAGGGASTDVDYPTRLGQEQHTLMLVVERDGSLIPWAQTQQPSLERPDAEFLSEVRSGANRLKRLALPSQDQENIQAIVAEWPDWKRHTTTVCPVSDDGSICSGLHYDAATGLQFPAEN